MSTDMKGLVGRLRGVKYVRDAWDEPYGAYSQPCDCDDYGAEAVPINPDGAEAATALEAQAEEIARLVTERDALKTEDEKLRRVVRIAAGIFDNCNVVAGVCGCGEDMKTHPPALSCGHVALDLGPHIVSLWRQEYSALHPTHEGER